MYAANRKKKALSRLNRKPLDNVKQPDKNHAGGKISTSSETNLDLVRLILALYVVYVHARTLCGKSEFIPSLGVPVDSAVHGFFILSGYLIFRSYERSKNIKEYFLKRFNRIYPPYALAVVGFAFGFSIISNQPYSAYFGWEWLNYLATNLIFANFLHPTLPGVFVTNPIEAAVNGSLWTLKVEVLFYLAVPLIALIIPKGKISRIVFIIILYTFSQIYYSLLINMDAGRHGLYELLAKQTPGQLRFFLLGVAAHYLNIDKIRIPAIFTIFPIIYFYIFGIDDRSLQYPALLAIIVLSISFQNYRIRVRSIGDLSYGIYLFHFPIIQLLVYLGIFEYDPGLGVIATYLVTTAIAVLSWNFVEMPIVKGR